jgi:cell division transport system permease protein
VKLGLLRVALVSALRAMAREPLAPLLGVGVVALGFLTTGFLAVVAEDLHVVATRGAPRAEMMVELADDADPARASELASKLAALPVVESVRRVEPGEAMNRLRESLGSEARVLEGLEPDFLPLTLEVTFRADVSQGEGAGVTATSALAERLEHTPGVARVVFLGEWVSRLGRLLRMARWVLLVALGLAGGGALYVVAATARLRALARRDEIEILKLVGATDRFVRAPFLIEALAVGALGAALGTFALWLVLGEVGAVVAAAPTSALSQGPALELVAALPWPLIIRAGLLCALLCGLCASLSVRRHARV